MKVFPIVEPGATAVEPDACGQTSHYEVDLGAIAHNYRQLRSSLRSTVKVYACLKRNGYGCGAGPVAARLAQEGIDGFAVASIADAVAIRQCGVSRPILLYPGAGTDSAPIIEALDLTISISSLDELHQWRAALHRVRAFIKADLGFFRAGATPAEIGPLLNVALADCRVEIHGIYAHMSELPGAGLEHARAQFDRMNAIIGTSRSASLPLPVVMMSSTEGVLNHPEMDFDAVDPGALLFGIAPGEGCVRRMTLRPALRSIATRLVCVKRIDASLGPAPEHLGMRSEMMIGVIGMGWGDGLPRIVPEGAEALVHGKRVRILPPAHLEHIRVDLTDVPEARFGDLVKLLGSQGNDVITHEQVMSQWNTDQIGLYAGLRDHIPRVYV